MLLAEQFLSPFLLLEDVEYLESSMVFDSELDLFSRLSEPDEYMLLVSVTDCGFFSGTERKNIKNTLEMEI